MNSIAGALFGMLIFEPPPLRAYSFILFNKGLLSETSYKCAKNPAEKILDMNTVS